MQPPREPQRSRWRRPQGNADLRSAQPAGGGRQGRTPSSGVVRLSAGTLAFSIIRTAAWYTPFAALRAAVPAPTGRTGRRSAFPCLRAVLPGGVGAETCAVLALGSTPSRPAARGGAGVKPPPGELAGVPGPHRENCPEVRIPSRPRASSRSALRPLLRQPTPLVRHVGSSRLCYCDMFGSADPARATC